MENVRAYNEAEIEQQRIKEQLEVEQMRQKYEEAARKNERHLRRSLTAGIIARRVGQAACLTMAGMTAAYSIAAPDLFSKGIGYGIAAAFTKGALKLEHGIRKNEVQLGLRESTDNRIVAKLFKNHENIKEGLQTIGKTAGKVLAVGLTVASFCNPSCAPIMLGAAAINAVNAYRCKKQLDDREAGVVAAKTKKMDLGNGRPEEKWDRAMQNSLNGLKTVKPIDFKQKREQRLEARAQKREAKIEKRMERTNVQELKKAQKLENKLYAGASKLIDEYESTQAVMKQRVLETMAEAGILSSEMVTRELLSPSMSAKQLIDAGVAANVNNPEATAALECLSNWYANMDRELAKKIASKATPEYIAKMSSIRTNPAMAQAAPMPLFPASSVPQAEVVKKEEPQPAPVKAEAVHTAELPKATPSVQQTVQLTQAAPEISNSVTSSLVQESSDPTAKAKELNLNPKGYLSTSTADLGKLVKTTATYVPQSQEEKVAILTRLAENHPELADTIASGSIGSINVVSMTNKEATLKSASIDVEIKNGESVEKVSLSLSKDEKANICDSVIKAEQQRRGQSAEAKQPKPQTHKKEDVER